ncbi:MAG: protein-L-isoaspartate(D-aspartate) O-methyltransferase, partial [Halanaerobiaceae bacterium]
KKYAYDDRPLPIEEGQTISQPYIVASMIQLLGPEAEDRVLEIGTGSGYAAAVLSRIVKRVYTIERHKLLASKAENIYKKLGYDNIEVKIGDGTEGWREKAPFSSILVSAAAPEIPDKLSEQLKTGGGKMIIPVGKKHGLQKLIRLTRKEKDEFEIENLEYVRFVPLIGKYGW